MSSIPRTTRNSQKSGLGDALQSLIRYGTPAPEASSSTLHSHPPLYPEGGFGSRISEEPDDDLEQPDVGNTITDDNDPSVHSDHNDETGIEDPVASPHLPDDPDASLASSLKLLANKIAKFSESSKKSSAVKPRVPDVFDGTDPNKLEAFVFQCSMYIATCAKDFPDDTSRVAFILSYLKGTPLDWFQTELSHAVNRGGKLPKWFGSYPVFLADLQHLFGPRDPVSDAMNALEVLKYKDGTKATRYILEFNRHSRRSGWNEQALARQFYKGLPDRLKDEISRIGKPVGLRPLQDLVSTLDQRHWERQAEVSREKRAASGNSGSSSKQNASSDNRSEDKQQASGSKTNSNQSSGKNKDQKKASNDAKKPSPSSPDKPNTISALLGPDGKLKPEERQRRLDKDLCLRCGNPGHKACDCPGNKPKPKGRAAKATPAAPEAAPASSGKA